MKPELLLSHADFVRTLARRLVLDEHLADDVVQETWMAALKQPPQKMVSLRAWLATVTRNFALMSHRKEKSRSLREKAAAQRESIQSTAKLVEWEAERRRVVKAVMGLDDLYRTVVIMRYYEELLPWEIAKRLEIPVETAKSRLKRGLALLRVHLDEKHGRDGTSWRMALLPLAGAAQATTSASTGTLATLTGVLAMSAKLKIVVAAMVVIAALMVIWISTEEEPPPPRTEDQVIASVMEPASMSDDPLSAEETEGGTGISGPEQDMRVTMQKTGISLLGTIVDEDGRPIQGAIIEEARAGTYTRKPAEADLAWMDMGHRTGQDGTFDVDIPRHERPLTFLRFSHSMHLSKSVAALKALPVSEDRFTLGRMRLTPASFILGRVRDEAGKGVAGATVTAPGAPWEDSNKDRAVTDEQGCFRLRLSCSESVRATACLDKCGAGWSDLVTPGPEGACPSVEIVLQQGGPIAGRILNHDDSPMIGLSVWAECENPGRTLRWKTFTDTQGGFRFSDLPKANYRLMAWQTGYPGNQISDAVIRSHQDYTSLATSIPAGTEGLVYHRSGSRVVVTLRDSGGKPITKTPTIILNQESVMNGIKDNIISARHECNARPEILTPGTFAFSGIQPAEYYELIVRVEDYDDLVLKEVTVPPPPDEAALNGVLDPITSLQGKVVFADGESAHGVIVYLERCDSQPDEAVFFAHTLDGSLTRGESLYASVGVTDGKGRFTIGQEKYGEYALYFNVNGMEVLHTFPVQLMPDIGQENLLITLPRLTNRIEGVVRDKEGTPLPNAYVVAWDCKWHINKTYADEAGRYCFAALPEGDYVVDARCLNITSMTQTPYLHALEPPVRCNAVVRNGDVCHLDLQVSDPWNSVVTGNVDVGSCGIPRDMRIKLGHSSDGRSEGTVETCLFKFRKSRHNEDTRAGRFRFENLPGGTYYLNVIWSDENGQNRQCLSDRFELATSTRHELNIAIGQASIKGRVTCSNTGLPIADAGVYLLEETGNNKDMKIPSREDGCFEGHNLRMGVYTLVVHHPGYQPYIMPNFVLDEGFAALNLLFNLEEGGLTLAGRVELSPDQMKERYFWYVLPVISPQVNLRCAGGDLDREGRFTLRGLPPGPVTLKLYHRGKFVTEKSIELPLRGEEDLVIEAP